MSSWFAQETSNLDSDPPSDDSPRAFSSAKSNRKTSKSKRRISKRLKNSNPISHKTLLYHLSRGDPLKDSFPPGIRLDPGFKAMYKDLRRLRTTLTPRATKSTTTPSADSTPTNPRRSTRLSGVQQVQSSSSKDSVERSEKRSISPNEPLKRKRPRLTLQPDKHANLVDPKIPGLPWRHLTSTMRERAIGYLKRNIIHRQSVTCWRCTQQTVARERIDEDCITMFDSQGGSIACFRCGYRQLTCSFANGALIPDTPPEIEPSESSQSETVQTTTGSSDSMPKDVAGPSSRSTAEIPRQVTTEQESPHVPSSHPADDDDVVATPTPRTPEPGVAVDKDIESQEQISPNRDMELRVESEVQNTDTFPDNVEPPSPQSNFNDEILLDSQLEGGSLASVLRENPATVIHRRSALRTYSRNDRTTLPSSSGTQADDLESGESDRPYTLRPAFSPEGSISPGFDDNNNDDLERAITPQFRSCSLRELPRLAAVEGEDNKLHESVHQFRALLHTHQSIIKMRQHIFSLLHANDSALRHSRQSLLNATTQLKQYPFPWDIPDEPPFDGLKDLADDLVCAWSNGFNEREAYEGIRKYDRAQMEVDRHEVDPVEEELDPYYYPNIAKDWSSGTKDMIE